MDRLPYQGWARELAMADAWVQELRQVLAKPDPCWGIEDEDEADSTAHPGAPGPENPSKDPGNNPNKNLDKNLRKNPATSP